MNNFYILLFAATFTGCLIGYLAGFIRVTSLFIKIAASLTAAYFFSFPLLNFVPVAGEWKQAIAFTIVFIVCLIITHYILHLLTKHVSKLHKNYLNKAAGAITGLAIAVIAVLSITQFTNVIQTPQLISNEIKARGVEDAFNNYAEIVNDKLVPIFQKQLVQVMSSKAVDTIIENGITLSFTTNEFEANGEMENEMLRLINEERAKYNLKLLSSDAQLAVAAKMHSSDMLTRGYFSHNTPEGINPFQRLHKLNIAYLCAGENLAMSPTLLKAHDGLMRSPGHRANILNPSYGRVGISILDAGVHGLMITQEFRN